MNLKARIVFQVMALGMGMAFGFGANQALAARQQPETSYQPCVATVECVEYCGDASPYCNSKGLCVCF